MIISEFATALAVGFPGGNPNGGHVRGNDLIIHMRSYLLIICISYHIIFVLQYISLSNMMVESSLFTTTAYTHSRSQIYADHHYLCVLSKGGIFT